MRLFRGVAASVAFLGLTVWLAVAGPAAANAQGAVPFVVYAAPPIPPAIPPVGYVLDPSDARKPIYIVNQGPVYAGPGIFIAHPIYTAAFPTHSEGGYAYADPCALYPSVKAYWAWCAAPGAKPYRCRFHGGAYRGRTCAASAGPYRPYGIPPYYAYRYLPAPSARVIQITPPRD